MTYYREGEVLKWNQDQEAERKGLTNLYVSMVQAKEGNSLNLEMQVMTKKKIYHIREDGKTKNRLDEYLVFVDKRLNKLLMQMSSKYGNNRSYKFGAKQHDVKFGVSASNRVFERKEIETMLLNYIMMFPYEYTEIPVPIIENFKGETDEHSNNKLIKYITQCFEKHIILRQLHNDKKTIRLMQDGKYTYVNQGLEVHLFGDLEPPKSGDEDEKDPPPTLEDLISDNALEHDWAQQSEFEFIKGNYRDVLTKNQLLCFEYIINTIEKDGIVIDDLFHKVYQGKLNVEEIGKILFPDKDNNYRQPAVRKMLKSMRQRMDKQLKKAEIQDERKVVRSDYRPLPDLPEKENKQFKEFNIGKKYLSKNYYINDLHKNVKFHTDEQIIPLYEYINLLTGKVMVADLMKKYGIDKNRAKLMNGAVSTYIIDDNGEYILIDKSFCEDDANTYKYIDSKNVKYNK
jgi:hypothetical protein